MLAAPAIAQETSQRRYAAFDGGQSCATWLADPRSEALGRRWIWGFFSGANYWARESFGTQTDGMGIIGEVKAVCDATPSKRLMDATSEVFFRMASEKQSKK